MTVQLNMTVQQLISQGDLAIYRPQEWGLRLTLNSFLWFVIGGLLILYLTMLVYLYIKFKNKKKEFIKSLSGEELKKFMDYEMK
jgi:hypothetical protein